MQLLRNSISLGLFFLLCQQCFSVQQLEQNTLTSARLPSIRPVAFDNVGAGSQQITEGVFRKRTDDIVRLVIRNQADRGKFEKRIKIMAMQKTMKLMKFSDVRFITPPPELKDLKGFMKPGPAREFLKQVNADAVCDFTFKREGEEQPGSKGSFILEAELINPLDGRQLALQQLNFEILFKGIDKNHQVDFYRNRNDFHALKPLTQAAVKLRSNGEKSRYRSFVRKSVEGKLFVNSSAIGTEVFLLKDGKRSSLGTAPVDGQVLEQGTYHLEFRRKGYAPLHRRFFIRSGQNRRIYATWPEDSRSSAVAILSSPPGLRLAIDGVVKGETPVYLSNMEAGAYDVELSRPNKDQEFEVMSESNLAVSGKKPAVRVFFVNYLEQFKGNLDEKDFWRLTSESGSVKYAPRHGLAFRTQTKRPVWQGLVSRRLVLDTMNLELEIPAGDKVLLRFGLISSSQSVLVHLKKGVFTPLLFQGKEASNALYAFKAVSKGATVKIKIEYDKKKKRVTLRVDGGKIFQGPWSPSVMGRIVILTKSEAADGRTLAKSLRVRSGRGLYEK